MGFFAEIQKLSGVVAPCRVTLFHGHCYVEGAQRILRLSTEEMNVQTAEGVFRIVGSNLAVCRFFEGDLLIKGDKMEVLR